MKRYSPLWWIGLWNSLMALCAAQLIFTSVVTDSQNLLTLIWVDGSLVLVFSILASLVLTKAAKQSKNQ